tara:strand:- start:288 stop:962 length:675 start_codon:yes stop_codon:yes gene_type:complete
VPISSLQRRISNKARLGGKPKVDKAFVKEKILKRKGKIEAEKDIIAKGNMVAGKTLVVGHGASGEKLSDDVKLKVNGGISCKDINIQYEFLRVGMDYDQSGGTKVMMMLDGGTRPKTTFGSSLESCCMIAPHNGTLEFISFRSEEVAGLTSISFHKASDGTEVPSDTATVSVSATLSADDTTTKFAFTSSNTFSAGDVLGFTVTPNNDINDCVFVIALKYDTTT